MPRNEFKRANLRMEYWPSALITRLAAFCARIR